MKRTLFLLLLFACLALCRSARAQLPGNQVAVGNTPNTQFVTAVNVWYFDTSMPGDFPAIAPHWTQVKNFGGSGSGSSVTAVSTTGNDPAPPSVTTTSGTVLVANASRKNASLKNEGTVQVTLNVSGTAAVAGRGITLEPKQAYTIDATNLYQGAVTAIVASGTSTLSIHEGY